MKTLNRKIRARRLMVLKWHREWFTPDLFRRNYRARTIVASLKDDRTYMACGLTSRKGRGLNMVIFDGANSDLILYKRGKFAKIIRKASPDPEEERIGKILRYLRATGMTSAELLKKDYPSIISQL